MSVVIPVCERPRLILECLDSVARQNFRDFETIVVDDGSKTCDIQSIVGAAFPEARVFRQENRGVSAARNLGIRKARGEMLALLDSDDIWKKDKLEIQCAFMRKRPDLLFSHTDEEWIRNAKPLRQKAWHEKSGPDLFGRSLARCIISPSTALFRREFFENVGFFDESLPACEDYDLWLRATCRMEPGYIDRKLSVRRAGHKDQLSMAPGLDKYRIQALVKLLETRDLSTTQTRAVLSALEKKCRIYGAGCRKRAKNTEARAVLALPDTLRSRHFPDSLT